MYLILRLARATQDRIIEREKFAAAGFRPKESMKNSLLTRPLRIWPERKGAPPERPRATVSFVYRALAEMPKFVSIAIE